MSDKLLKPPRLLRPDQVLVPKPEVKLFPFTLGVPVTAFYDAIASPRTEDASNVVEQWDDISGSELHLSQSSAGSRPTYRPEGFAGPGEHGVGGTPCMDFPYKFLTSSGSWPEFSDGFTLVALMQATVDDNPNKRFMSMAQTGLNDFNGNGGFALQNQNNTGNVGAYVDGTSTLNNQKVNDGQYEQIAYAVTSNAVDTVSLYTNGALVKTDSGAGAKIVDPDLVNLGGQIIGGVAAGSSSFRIASLIIFHGELTQAQVRELSVWLALRYEVRWSPRWALYEDGLSAFYYPADGNTVTESSGSVSNLECLYKLTTGAPDMAQGTGANQPSIGTDTLNAKNVLELTDPQYMATSSNITAPKFVFSVALANSSIGVLDGLAGHGSNGDQLNIRQRDDEFLNTTTITVWNDDDFAYDDGAYYLNGIEETVFTQDEAFILGVQGGTAADAYDTSVPWGISEGSYSRYWEGYMAAHALFDSIPPAATRQIFEGWFAHEYAINDLLPSDHPYKFYPPLVGGGTPSNWSPAFLPRLTGWFDTKVAAQSVGTSWSDLSPHGNDLSWTGNSTVTADNLFGNESVKTPDDASNASYAYSGTNFSQFMTIQPTASIDNPMTVGPGFGSSAAEYYVAWVHSVPRFRFGFDGGINYNNESDPTDIAPGVDATILVAYDGAKARLYVDGTLLDDDVETGTLSFTGIRYGRRMEISIGLFGEADWSDYSSYIDEYARS